MNLIISSADGRASLRISGSRRCFVLRTSFNPFCQREFVAALERRYRLERVGRLTADMPDRWLGIVEVRPRPDQEDTLVEDLAELMNEYLRM